MKALRFAKTGSLDELKIQEVPRPVPGPGSILVAVKAAGGGGGKGFRVAESEDKLQEAFEGSSREGDKFFGDPTVRLTPVRSAISVAVTPGSWRTASMIRCLLAP